jgi:hypothetical protein
MTATPYDGSFCITIASVPATSAGVCSDNAPPPGCHTDLYCDVIGDLKFTNQSTCDSAFLWSWDLTQRIEIEPGGTEGFYINMDLHCADETRTWRVTEDEEGTVVLASFSASCSLCQ